MKIECYNCGQSVTISAKTLWRCPNNYCYEIPFEYLEKWKRGKIDAKEFFGDLSFPITVLSTSYAARHYRYKSYGKISELDSDYYNPHVEYDDCIEECFAMLHLLPDAIFFINEYKISSYDADEDFDFSINNSTSPINLLSIKPFASQITKESSRILTGTCYDELDFKTINRVYCWGFLAEFSGQITLGLKSLREKEARSLIGNVQKEVHLPNIERIDGGALAVLSRNCRYLELGLKNLSLEQAKILGRGFGTLNLPNITRSRLGGKYEYINKRQGSLSFKDFYRGCIII